MNLKVVFILIMCSKISKFCEEKEAFYIDDNNMP